MCHQNFHQLSQIKPQIRPPAKHGPENLTDQSMNMSLTADRKLTNEIASPKKFIQNVQSKNFTSERTQTTESISTNSNLIDNTNSFDFTDLKME